MPNISYSTERLRNENFRQSMAVVLRIVDGWQKIVVERAFACFKLGQKFVNLVEVVELAPNL